MVSNETFKGLAFPVARVRYAGPTNYRGSRWIASIRRDNERTYRSQVSYRSELPSGSQNAIRAALTCLATMLADNPGLETSANDYVAAPGELSADEYVFTFVPRYFWPES